jgi:alcohol dehydrogenase (cytochrome c)
MFSRTARRTILIGILTLFASALIAWQAQAPQIPFTAAQADQGKALYDRSCAECHGERLDNGEFAPPLRGAKFGGNWAGKPVEDLLSYIGTRMPPSSPGSLGAAGSIQVLAYIMQYNGANAGNTALTAAALKGINIPIPTGRRAAPGAGPSGGISEFYKEPLIRRDPANPFEKYTPVTDAMIANQAPGEWLTWRRGYDSSGYSPLRQINKTNVSELRLAWGFTLSPGPNENTPLVHDGVLFVHSFGDRVQALNAVTGDILWQYVRQMPEGMNGNFKRAISLYRDKVYVGTSDGHMVALDAKSGKVIWDEEVTPRDPKVAGAVIMGGPLVAKGKVMVGTQRTTPGGPQIVGMDAETGKVAWRFHVIAQPGDPAFNTWNGVPLDKRSGGAVWVPGSYDPETGLAYFGTAQTYDTGPLRVPVNQPGISNEALYTDSTLAIDPDTGKLAWNYQHLANDQWDLDWVFERQIINLPVNGQNRKLVLASGKAAIYDALDAKTGKYAFSYDSGLQNFITSIDPVTGAKKIDVSKVPGDGEVKFVCPHAGGAKSWMPGSYNPVTKIAYAPLVESCMDLYPVGAGGGGSLSTGVAWAIRPRPSADGNYGRLQAVNLQTRKQVWVARHRAPESSGTLDTAGGVVFSGTNDRYLRAYDDATGKVLWETRLNDLPSSAPITYSVNGKQYLAVVVGNGGAQALTFPALTPELKMPPDRGSSIFVFALPDRLTKPAGAKQ